MSVHVLVGVPFGATLCGAPDTEPNVRVAEVSARRPEICPACLARYDELDTRR